MQVLNEDLDATVLFVAPKRRRSLSAIGSSSSRNLPSMLWSACTCWWRRFRVGRCVRVEALGGRRRLVLGETRVHATTYALIAADEAHHLATASSELARLVLPNRACCSRRRLAGDGGDAGNPEEIARSLVELQDQKLSWRRSRKWSARQAYCCWRRRVSARGRAQGRDVTHGASAGPPLVARSLRRLKATIGRDLLALVVEAWRPSGASSWI